MIGLCVEVQPSVVEMVSDLADLGLLRMPEGISSFCVHKQNASLIRGLCVCFIVFIVVISETFSTPCSQLTALLVTSLYSKVRVCFFFLLFINSLVRRDFLDMWLGGLTVRTLDL